VATGHLLETPRDRRPTPAREVIGGLYTSWELAELLDLAPELLSRWRQSGDGPPFVRIGQRAYYRLTDIRQWIASLPAGQPRARPRR
jgi:Helix-turn-helix domain